MTVILDKSKNSFSEFHADLENEGFHIFSKKKSKIKGFYPNEFPKYEGININNLKEGDVVTIRVFFLVAKVPVHQADGGYIDLEIELVENDIIYGNILTELPDHFPLAKNTTIELSIDEILNYRPSE